jgi:hypothetical protein
MMRAACECQGRATPDDPCLAAVVGRIDGGLDALGIAPPVPPVPLPPANFLTRCERRLCRWCIDVGERTGICCGCGEDAHAIKVGDDPEPEPAAATTRRARDRRIAARARRRLRSRAT